MNKLVLLSVLLIFSSSSFCQSSTDSVKVVVNKMFVAMKNSDESALLACFADSAILQTVTINSEGKASVKNESVPAFAKLISSLPKEAADEQITYDMIKVDGDLASVWTPYKFYYNGKFLHCGVNSFQLVRINDSWKIQYIIDTRRKDNCK